MKLVYLLAFFCLGLVLAVIWLGASHASSIEDRYIEELRRHYERLWGSPSSVTRWMRGPTHDLPAQFRIAVFPPRDGRSYWVYATLGMSLGMESGLELHLRSLRESEELVELLTVTAHYHRTGARLGLYHTVNFGRPWLQGSLCDHGFITLPHVDDPQFEWLALDGLKVHNLWLVPITASEREYKKKNGPEALEQLFDRSNSNVLDPNRKSVM